jgi:cytoskeletal protein CcmA (bactofilin family)
MKFKDLASKLGRTAADDEPAMPLAPPVQTDEGSAMSEAEKPKSAFHPVVSRRAADIPPAPMPRGDGAQYDPKTLIVGREITLSGEITACERLLVEGKVEVALGDCRIIEIAESGLFKGAAEIQEADIRGRFEGKLTVRGRLLIRATGTVTGEIRYGEIEIERGGTILGQIGASNDSSITKSSKKTETAAAE